jgi:outer membrane cobalamin receptor
MKKGRGVFLWLLLLLASGTLHAQSALDARVSIHVEHEPLEQALFTLIEHQHIRLSFSNDIIPRRSVSVNFSNAKLRTVLDALLRGTDLAYREVGNQVVLYADPKEKTQRKFTISGFVEDAASGERLIAASVLDRRLGKGVETNEYGFFSLTLPEGEVRLSAYYLGYIPQEYVIQLNSDKEVTISLSASLSLPEVEVIARDSITSGLRSGISTNLLDAEDVRSLPALGGEPDLIRATHFLPGVQTGTDGIGGIHIRGGNPEHNLILIDGVPVYNALHAAGLFSVFNTDAIRSAQLIKGGFPARYGGRLSSVLDVHTKEGNMNRLSGQAEVGLLTARASLEGPIVKDKGSFFVSARRSFLNWYIEPLSQNQKERQGEDGKTSYEFYDVNAKLNYNLSEKDKVYLSFYRGNDHFRNTGFRSGELMYYDHNLEDTAQFRFDQSYAEKLSWGNTIAAARWNHIWGNKLFSNTTLTYSRFGTDISYSSADSLIFLNMDETVLRRLDFGIYRSSIRDLGAKVDFDWLLSPSQTIRFGAGITHHRFNPGVLTYNEATEHLRGGDVQGNEPIDSEESFAYIEDQIIFGDKLSLNVGVHAARLSVQGKTYSSLQPRASAYWQMSDRLGWKASYGEMAQFVHLLTTNSSVGLPTDLWVPATADVPPQRAWQVSSGFDYDFDLLTLSVEGYYKEMNNLLNFTEGAFFLNDWQSNVTTGNGRAYGTELLLQKSRGKTTGWIAYTLAWADRRFELINFGERFPFRFDRRHDVKVVLQHAFSKWMRVSASWMFSSGFAYSLPLSEYSFPITSGDPVPVTDFGSKNAYRMPNYHRLDINAQLRFQTRNFLHGVNIGFYNIYDRRNPLYFDLRTDIVNDGDRLREEKEFVQVWLLPFLPSVNYSIKF